MALQFKLIQENKTALLQFLEVLPPDNGKRKVGIEFRRNIVGGLGHLGVYRKPRMFLPSETINGSDPGSEVVFRGLCYEAIFKGKAVKLNIVLRIA